MISRASLIRAGTLALHIVPYPAARALAILLADICWRLLGERRRTLEQNLVHTAPGRSRDERRRLARLTFRNFALCTIDSLRLPFMSSEELRSLDESSGRDHIDTALAGGRGAILVTAHVGNFELGGAWLAALGYPVYAIAEDLDPEVYEAVGRYRSATGMKLLSRDRGAVAAFRSLKRNQLLVLIGDRAIGRGGVPVDFCGRPRPIPLGTATLALRTGAPIIVGHLVLDPTGERRYTSVFEPLDIGAPTADGAGDIERVTRLVARELCRIVRQYPDQWFVFQPEWLAVDG